MFRGRLLDDQNREVSILRGKQKQKQNTQSGAHASVFFVA